MRRWRGFTFVELMITIAIVGILASVALPLSELAVTRAKEAELRSGLREMRQAIDAYKLASDEGRIGKAAGASGFPPRLEVLAAGVPDRSKAEGGKLYFLRRVPRDPFFDDARVPAAQTWGLRSYSSPPEAPQPGEDVFDVFSTSTRTGINGLAYREW